MHVVLDQLVLYLSVCPSHPESMQLIEISGKMKLSNRESQINVHLKNVTLNRLNFRGTEGFFDQKIIRKRKLLDITFFIFWEISLF
jgi:hypothetical protein